MQIITIANTKGGTGKSTLSVHLAYYLQRYERKGQSTVLIDADTQSSSSQWISSSPLKLKAVLKAKSDQELYALIKNVEADKDIQFCIIDCPSGLPDVARTAIMLATMVIIPTQPHLLDLQSGNTMMAFLEQVRRVRDGFPSAYIFLNRCLFRTLLMREAEQFLRANGQDQNIVYIPKPLYNRIAVADAPNQRSFVFEMEDDKAHQEMFSLCQYLYNIINPWQTNVEIPLIAH